MRRTVLGIALSLSAANCGGATATQPTAAFALAAGNYTLKVIGTGICSGTEREGTAPVTVTHNGAAWSVTPVQAGDSFTMSFTTDGAAMGSVRGETSGLLTVNAGLLKIGTTGSITGANSGNTAGGPTQGISFLLTSGLAASTCLSGTWTLTPR